MKKYELSLSRNYVSSWGIEEAIRELLQNAKDSNGEDIIDIDKSSGTITITNKNTSIPSSTLLLGNTSKKDDLGIWTKFNPTITSNKIKIKVDDLYAPNTINCEELYKKWLLGKFNKKEGNKMIESINLIDLYANKHRESIEKETKEKVEELRKKCDVINKYNELVEQFEKDCDELYLSQFTEEEKNKILINKDMIDDADMQLRTTGEPSEVKYYTNKNFCNDDYYKLMDERESKLNEINDLVKTVKAHVGIAKTKEEVEEILTRYGIIDKKGKLVIK